MKKRCMSLGLCIAAMMLMTFLWAEAAHALTVQVNNNGDRPLYICFVYTAPSGARMVKGWWKVEAYGNRGINLGQGYSDQFGKTFAYHATRGKTRWGNGSGGELSVTSSSFNYNWATGSPDGAKPYYAKFTEVKYKGTTHNLTFK